MGDHLSSSSDSSSPPSPSSSSFPPDDTPPLVGVSDEAAGGESNATHQDSNVFLTGSEGQSESSDDSGLEETGTYPHDSQSSDESSVDEAAGIQDLGTRIPQLLLSLLTGSPSSQQIELDSQQSLLVTLTDEDMENIGPRSPLIQNDDHDLRVKNPSPFIEPTTKNTFRLLSTRETSGSHHRRTLFVRKAEILPTGKASHRARITSVGEAERFFCGQFSPDGNFFVSSSRDEHIRILDADDWSKKEDVLAREVGWSVVDLDVSPDLSSIIYSSWSNKIYCYNRSSRQHYPIRMPFPPGAWNFCTFALKFSGDSQRIVAGCSRGRLAVLDVERRLPILAHQPTRTEDREDINAVAWCDPSSSVFFTGSDNSFVEVWDHRMSLDEPVKQLVGHLAGVTHINSRNDGRYLISNSKDQSIRLWDLRKAHDWEPGRAVLIDSSWDYRYGSHPRTAALFSGRLRRVDDCSVMSYRGHQVHQTLIRAFFSPVHSTGQRYIYSGSGNGCVYIWDVLGGQVERVLPGHAGLVRDVSWHPYQPQIVSSSWDRKLYWWGTHTPRQSKHLVQDLRRLAR